MVKSTKGIQLKQYLVYSLLAGLGLYLMANGVITVELSIRTVLTDIDAYNQGKRLGYGLIVVGSMLTAATVTHALCTAKSLRRPA